MPTHASSHASDVASIRDRVVPAVEAICALPTVPTRNWCALAAQALSSLRCCATCAVAVVSLGEGAAISNIEAAGVSRSGGPAASSMEESGEGIVGPTDAVQQSVLCAIHAMRRLPWSPRDPIAPTGEVAVVPDILEGAQPRMIAGIAPIARGSRRCVLVMGPGNGCSTSGRPSPDALAVLASILPSLANRALRALGPTPVLRTNWLSQREQRVLEMIVGGLGVREISELLGRSPHTVHDHIKSLHRKLGASSRSQLVARALGGPLADRLIDPKPLPNPNPSAAGPTPPTLRC